jgi:hypothetical protein
MWCADKTRGDRRSAVSVCAGIVHHFNACLRMVRLADGVLTRYQDTPVARRPPGILSA